MSRPILPIISLCLALAACQSSTESGSSTFRNLLMFGGTTVPPAAGQKKEEEEILCPAISVFEGGAALQSYAGQVGPQENLRHQLSLGQTARECTAQPDGSIKLRVGIEGRAILGPKGQAGQFSVPLRIVVKRGEQIVASHSRSITVSVPQGETFGSFVAVEDGIIVPKSAAQDYEIEIGLGGGETKQRTARKKR